jgi:hypothetical protein
VGKDLVDPRLTQETTVRRTPDKYPEVRDEFETLDAILGGKSIARFGDGEFNHVRGRKNVSQVADERLTAEITQVLVEPTKRLIVGIPRLDERNPKNANWVKYAPGYACHLNRHATYYSSFISRPDNAPHINNAEFFDKVESLWKGQTVTLVGNGVRSLKAEFLCETGANEVRFVQCTYRDSYAQIDHLEEAVQRQGCERVLLCCGPAATVLAWRLARRGFHALDLGHIGMLWRPYLREPKPEQREINKETGLVEPNP